MKNDKISLLKHDDVLIVPVHGELDDDELDSVKSGILKKVSADERVHGVILDLTNLETMDLHGARLLMRLIKMLSLMDLHSVMVGIQPEVAITLTDIDLSFPGVATAISLEQGIVLLRRATSRDSKTT